MGFFDKHQKPGHTARKQEKPKVHTETVTNTASPQISPFMHAKLPRVRHSVHKAPPKEKAPRAKPSPKPATARSRKRAADTQQHWDDDADSDVSNGDLSRLSKRTRKEDVVESDVNRQIRSRKAFSDEDNENFPMIHGSAIASLDNGKYKLAFPDHPQATEVSFQYPSASQRENYALVTPIQQASDDFQTLVDIRASMETIIHTYLSEEEAATLSNDSTGLLRRLKRAMERLAGSEYLDHIQEWNDTMVELRKNEIIGKTMDQWKAVDLELVERILTQTYSRTVSPRVHELRHYQNGTDNVYGELLPRFISTILKKDTSMKSNQIFVDLGSGVGNCVLQAALEVGCESYGCEMMDNACDLAELQVKEFEARCRLWGLNLGSIHLERGDFMKNEGISTVLPDADLVLVNNQAFTPDLNDRLVLRFLDLKEGAKVVSLRPFKSEGNKNEARTAAAMNNMFDVVKKEYHSGHVSWTDAPGNYYVSTKNSARFKA